MTEVDLLRATELFAKLTAEELDSVARCVAERDVAPGEVLIREDQPGQSLFLLRHGKVAVEKTLAGRTIRLAELGPGAVFGEMSLIDNFPTSASVVAVEPCSLLLIGRLDLNVLLNWDTVLAAKMWRSFTEMLCYRLRSTNERLLARLGDDAGHELIAGTVDIDAR
jgi:CRP-like cAMP-binding protein